jgi:hypothetical protein
VTEELNRRLDACMTNVQKLKQETRRMIVATRARIKSIDHVMAMEALQKDALSLARKYRDEGQ